MSGFNMFSSREFDTFLKNANNLLDRLLREISDPNSSIKLIEVMDGMESLRHQLRKLQTIEKYRHAIPEEIEEKIETVNQILAEKSLGDDINSWYDLIKNSIDDFIFMFDIIEMRQELANNETDKLQIRQQILRYTEPIKKIINSYENKFGSSFDPSLKEKFNEKKNQLAKEFELHIEPNEKPMNVPLEIKTIDSDQLLDLYEEIKKMPEGEEKSEKIKEFEKMQKIIKGSYNIKLSNRE